MRFRAVPLHDGLFALEAAEGLQSHDHSIDLSKRLSVIAREACEAYRRESPLRTGGPKGMFRAVTTALSKIPLADRPTNRDIVAEVRCKEEMDGVRSLSSSPVQYVCLGPC